MVRMIGIGDNVVDCNYSKGIMYPGGNALNFAVFGKQAGCETAYLGVLGCDQEANLISASLKAQGVDFSKCVVTEDETGRCGIWLNDGDRIIKDENDAGAVKSTPLQLTEEVLDYVQTFDVAHSSCFSHIEDQLYKIRERGIPLIYDFSDVWVEKDFEEICPNISIAFFSGKDLQEEKLIELIRRAVDVHGCMLGITTVGERGAYVYDGNEVHKKMPYNFEGGVIDTTGAGDSWIAAFAATYFTNVKVLERLMADRPENFMRAVDVADYKRHIVESAMCAANALARRNCLVDGSFGHGIQLV